MTMSSGVISIQNSNIDPGSNPKQVSLQEAHRLRKHRQDDGGEDERIILIPMSVVTCHQSLTNGDCIRKLLKVRLYHEGP